MKPTKPKTTRTSAKTTRPKAAQTKKKTLKKAIDQAFGAIFKPKQKALTPIVQADGFAPFVRLVDETKDLEKELIELIETKMNKTDARKAEALHNRIIRAHVGEINKLVDALRDLGELQINISNQLEIMGNVFEKVSKY